MHNHAPDAYICPFCLLVQGIENERVYSAHSDIVLRNKVVTALISAHQWPRTPGHVIIIPNAHYENIYDLPLDAATEIHAAARSVALAMKRAYGCDGISTRQHNEPAGNQDVWHYHLHVFPRYANDNLYRSKAALMNAVERATYAGKLRQALAEDC
jgi:histidine triad (HIT) family protein